MASKELVDFLGGDGENLGFEYKAWMDVSDETVRAKLARHLAALSNHGGGYIVFGVDDDTRLPLGAAPADLPTIDQAQVAGIVKRYLEPVFNVQVDLVEKDGVSYPVIAVPPHGARPVISIRGRYDAKGKPDGIVEGRIYVRAAGPESVEIKTADDWNALLDRCLAHRGDHLAKIMRQGLAKTDRPSRAAVNLLRAAVESTAADFAGQVAALAAEVPEEDRTWVGEVAERFSALGYALLDADGEAVELSGLRGIVDRASFGMQEWADAGWSAFYPVNGVRERAPQFRTETLEGDDRRFLEGMRLAASGTLWGSVDYWRLYEDGIGVWVDSYREDSIRARNGGDPYLTFAQVLFHLHSLLAHARLVGQETPDVAQVAIRQDWRGLQGRTLTWDRHRFVVPGQCADDRFAKTTVLRWSDLRDDYFNTLRGVVLAFLEVFPPAGWRAPEDRLDRALAERELARFEGGSVRLFDD